MSFIATFETKWDILWAKGTRSAEEVVSESGCIAIGDLLGIGEQLQFCHLANFPFPTSVEFDSQKIGGDRPVVRAREEVRAGEKK